MTLFRGIDGTTKVAFAVSVHKRDAATLIALFSKKTSKVFQNLAENDHFTNF